MKLLSLLIFVSSWSFAEEFTLTENNVIAMSKASNPSLMEIEASFLASKVRLEELKDRFGFEAYAQYGHQNTNEKAIVVFQPVFTNINQ